MDFEANYGQRVIVRKNIPAYLEKLYVAWNIVCSTCIQSNPKKIGVLYGLNVEFHVFKILIEILNLLSYAQGVPSHRTLATSKYKY